jgi:hypothetical protein
VNAAEQHPEGDSVPDTRKARTDPQVIPQSQLNIIRVSGELLVGEGVQRQPSTIGRALLAHGDREKAPSHPHESHIALERFLNHCKT